MLNRSSDTGDSCFVSNLRGKSNQSLPIKYLVSCKDFFVDAIFQAEEVPFYLSSLTVFLKFRDRCKILSNE